MSERKTVQVKSEVKQELTKLIATEPNVKSESNMIALLIEHYQKNSIAIPEIASERLQQLREELGLENDAQVIFYLLAFCSDKRLKLTIAEEKKYIEDAIFLSNQLSL